MIKSLTTKLPDIDTDVTWLCVPLNDAYCTRQRFKSQLTGRNQMQMSK